MLLSGQVLSRALLKRACVQTEARSDALVPPAPSLPARPRTLSSPLLKSLLCFRQDIRKIKTHWGATPRSSRLTRNRLFQKLSRTRLSCDAIQFPLEKVLSTSSLIIRFLNRRTWALTQWTISRQQRSAATLFTGPSLNVSRPKYTASTIFPARPTYFGLKF